MALPCRVCGMTFNDSDTIIPFEGRRFHKVCFKCQLCKTSLEDGQASNVRGLPYCSTCFPKANTAACAGCHENIGPGPVVSIPGQKYHVRCFACVKCKNLIEGGYRQRAEGLLCVECSTPAGRKVTTEVNVMSMYHRNVGKNSAPTALPTINADGTVNNVPGVTSPTSNSASSLSPSSSASSTTTTETTTTPTGDGVTDVTTATAQLSVDSGAAPSSESSSSPIVVMKPTFVPGQPVVQEKTIVNSDAAAFFQSNRIAQLLQEEAKYKTNSIVDTSHIAQPEPYQPRMSAAIDPAKLNQESRLSEEEFEAKMGMTRAAYNALPRWKQMQMKKDKRLF